VRHPGLWSLPGPRRFVKDVVDRLYRGRSVTLRDAHGADGLLGALATQIGGDSFLRLQSIDLREAQSLLTAMNEALAIDLRSLAALAVNEDAQATVFLLHLADARHAADIQTFVRAGRLTANSEAPVVVAACDDDLEELGDEHWDDLDAAGLVGPLDGMAFAAAYMSEADSLTARIKAAVAVEVGAWDLGLTETLLDLPAREALRPDLCPDQWVAPDSEAAAQHVDGWGGEPTRHAAWMARNDLAGLRKRVWRGQLGVLFPWIEERRREVITRYRSFLKVNDNTMPNIDLFDWGPISIQLQNSALGGCPQAVHLAREIRNELAHSRPVSSQQISRCIEAFRAWAGN
jgi:hypothetical protein